MKRITVIIVCAISAIVFMALLKPPGYKNTLYGSWQLVKEVVYLSDTTVSGEFPPNSNIYNFLPNDSVEIIYRNVDTTYIQTGWELNGINEDTIVFSEGSYMHIYNKTETSFQARYPLDVNSNEYVEANFFKNSVIMKKVIFVFGIFLMVLTSCTKNNEDGEDNYFYGLWNITHMKTVEFEDSISTDVAYGDYTYLFKDDGNVTITTSWEPTQTLEWELSADEDSILFSSGTYFHVTEKEDQYFKVKFVEEPMRTEYTFSR